MRCTLHQRGHKSALSCSVAAEEMCVEFGGRRWVSETLLRSGVGVGDNGAMQPVVRSGEPARSAEAGALEVVRAALLDQGSLVRALASGRRRGFDPPAYLRVEVRYVDLKGERHLQITEFDERQAHTRNV